MEYSLFNLIRHSYRGHRNWKPAWRNVDPAQHYDVIIIGGGGHGLATAYYLASEHGIHNVAVLEKNWIGSGNAGRNTTIVRANYLLPQNQAFYEFSLKQWEGLEQRLNFNLMMSQRGIINLYHSQAQKSAFIRRGNAMRLHGTDAQLLSREQLAAAYPLLDFNNPRFPILGGLSQPRAGTARHDGVVWGYARAADRLGVDIIPNCEVTALRVESGQITGVETTRGIIRANKVGISVAGNSSQLAAMAGLRLPIESHVLQAFVSEALKPILDTVITFGVGHFYISQSDKGGLVFGGDIDGYNSYAQRGNLDTVEHVVESGIAMMPMLSRLRLLRSWGGIVDMSMDGSPIIDKTSIGGLYLNAGWCYGGFKATPACGWTFAHTIATDQAHPLNTAFRLDRFTSGRVIDERGSGPTPRAH